MPQRSPMPLIVPCTCVGPGATAASVLATARSQSLWRVDADRHRTSPAAPPRRPRRPPRAACRRWCRTGTSTLAPASCGGLQRLQRVLGVALEAVEEMLGVVDHLAARRRAVGRPSRAIIRRFSSSDDAEHLVDVQVPGLADDRDDRRLRRRAAPSCPGRPRPAMPLRRVMPKAATLACLSVSSRTSWKILGVLGVRERDSRPRCSRRPARRAAG